jgi:MoxR-like ATPase
LPEVVAIMGAGLNLFLVGPAGSGKSTLAHQAAEALGLGFQALSLGPTTPTSKLFGYMDAAGNYVRTPFREAYENGGVILLDELDNGHPGLVAEINQATANGYCAFADGMVKRHENCRIVATGNTFGRGPDRLFVGRNILDAATLDRFVTVEVLVDERLERALANGYAQDDAALAKVIGRHVDLVQKVRGKVEAARLPLVVSPRASIDGAALIAAGIAPERAAEIRLFPGWSTEHRSKAGV